MARLGSLVQRLLKAHEHCLLDTPTTRLEDGHKLIKDGLWGGGPFHQHHQAFNARVPHL